MILRNASLEKFIEKIKNEKRRVIIFGAGVLSHVFLQYIHIQKVNITIDYIVDNAPEKIGKVIEGIPYKIEIKGTNELDKLSDKNSVVLIASSYYYEIIQSLDLKVTLKTIECYVLPIMFVTHLKLEQTNIVSNKSVIPKKIHYMWFGSEKLPQQLQLCVDSWKRYCPEYEIICWNEKNYDVSKCNYTKQAYEKKAWGFIPDYARVDILYNHGGIYMDTDVELIRNLDEMLCQTAFASVEKWQVINLGGCAGAIPHNEAIKRILDIRKNVSFINHDGTLNRMASGYYDTIPFIKEGFLLNGKNQSFGGMNIYASDYFHPYDYMTGHTNITSHTYGIHHFNGGWIDEESKKERKRTQDKYLDILLRMEWSL